MHFLFTITALLLLTSTLCSAISVTRASGHECSTESDCSDGLSCIDLFTFDSCVDSSTCTCIPSSSPTSFTECTTSADCDESGFKCLYADGFEDFRICYPGEFASLPGVVDVGKCIDARALEEGGHALVFERHVLSRVLCDVDGSCATGGHVVVWKGAGMMMRSYCERVECSERIVAVNSPRWSRGLRVKSRTKGLEFTAFAARYETRGEEMAMAAMVRVGL